MQALPASQEEKISKSSRYVKINEDDDTQHAHWSGYVYCKKSGLAGSPFPLVERLDKGTGR
jgi:hypothetical protein